MQEERVDPRLSTAEELAEGVRQAQTFFKLNHVAENTIVGGNPAKFIKNIGE